MRKAIQNLVEIHYRERIVCKHIPRIEKFIKKLDSTFL